jgi:hypothetical protein
MRMTLETAPNNRSALNEMRHLDHEHGDLVRSTRARIHEFVRGVIVDGINAGDFDAVHPGVATNSLFALMDGTLAWYRTDGSLSPAEIADWYVTLFVTGLGREEASWAAAAGERRAAP